MEPSDRKPEMRERARARRAGLCADREAASARIATFLLPELLRRRPRVVGAYRALADEIDPAPIVAALRKAGVTIALPAVERRHAPLVFRHHREGDPLRRSAFGIAEPVEGAPVLRPDMLLVPLLAFDREGFRLGFGAGYYDRTIAALRAAGDLFTVGLAFAAQEVTALPHEPHDMTLDLVATETGLVWPRCAEGDRTREEGG
ncbi:MAG: 5-formyltetrahydrofolate cyclo-ligase [Rhodothalassiaceae bacterium]